MLEHRRRNSIILFSTATRHRTHHTHITHTSHIIPPHTYHTHHHTSHSRVPRGLRFDGDGEVGSRIGPRGGVLEAGGGCDGHGGGVTVLRWCEPRDQAVLGVEGWGWKVKHTQGWVELGGVVDWEAARCVHPWLCSTPLKSCPLYLRVHSSSLLPPPLYLLPYPVLCVLVDPDHRTYTGGGEEGRRGTRGGSGKALHMSSCRTPWTPQRQSPAFLARVRVRSSVQTLMTAPTVPRSHNPSQPNIAAETDEPNGCFRPRRRTRSGSEAMADAQEG